MSTRKLVSTVVVSGLLTLVVLIGQATPLPFRPGLPLRSTVLPNGESSVLPSKVNGITDAGISTSQRSPLASPKETEGKVGVGASPSNPMAIPASAGRTGTLGSAGIAPAGSGFGTSSAGYLGNAVIYPTNDTGPAVFLSPESASGNQSIVCSTQDEAMNNTVVISVAS